MCVGGVRGDFVNGGDEILVEEDLSDVRRVRGVEAGDGSVGEDSGFVGWVGEDYEFVSIGIGLTKGELCIIPWM